MRRSKAIERGIPRLVKSLGLLGRFEVGGVRVVKGRPLAGH